MEIIPTQKIINRDGIKAVKNGQKANEYSSVPNQKKPEWSRVKATFDKRFDAVKQHVQDKRLNTVCEEAMCPNISDCLLYTSPSPRDGLLSRMPSSA